ncbi:prophage tail fiber N-terminal domain-containing protein, partial [Gilliamella sp. B3493]
MAKISGVLTDGAGNVINNCTIELYAKKTTSKVLTQTQVFQVANNGSYMMNVLPCDYEVKLIINGFPPKRLGSIQVFSDSKDGTLNDFLLNPSESEITPAILQQVIDSRNHANKSAEKSANSERNSKISETNAKTSADNAKNIANSVENLVANASNSAQSASSSSATATNASASAKSYSDS